jgi:hypothetical protein
MKKADQKKLSETLDKALQAPPRRMPKQALDNLLDEYDEAQPKHDSTAGVPEYRSTPVIQSDTESPQVISTIEHSLPQHITGAPQYRSTAVPEQQSPIPTREFYRKANQTADHVDRQLTPAESKVLDHLLRLSVGFNRDRCQVRVTVLMDRTGYRSDKTVRAALTGLEMKGVISRVSHGNSPAGDEYIIQPYSGNTAVPEYRSTAAENTGVLESKVTGQLNTSLKDKSIDDDAALAGLIRTLKNAAREITGKEPSTSEGERWKELGEVLVTELKIAAARTSSVSSVPSFLAEHLRRRLFKKDKAQIESEGREATTSPATLQLTNEQISKCPDCGGSGMYYPEGYEKGVAKCRHEELKREGN